MDVSNIKPRCLWVGTIFWYNIKYVIYKETLLIRIYTNSTSDQWITLSRLLKGNPKTGIQYFQSYIK